MKAIFTKYHGPGNVRGSRIIAKDSDGNKVIVSLDCALNHDDNHKQAAIALCRKMGWTGKLAMGGGLDNSEVFVWTDSKDLVEVS
jgi:hypothetical protein